MTDKQDIQNWWAQNPMTYGDTHGKTRYGDRELELGDRAFFDQVDAQFHDWNKPLHGARPFDRIFPFDEYKDKKVLEIGCGMGTMAMHWARSGARVTAVDLNPTSIEQTRRRFRIHGLDADIHQEDANRLSFPDGTFDYAWSWGVLHHSPDLERSLAEMMRVCRPGAGFGIMLYNRRSLWHWYTTLYVEGFLHRESKFLNPLQLASRYGDGYREEGNPHTWPVTPREFKEMLAPYSRDVNLKILGTELDGLFELMLPGLGSVLPRAVKKVWARRFGWSLWAWGHRV